MLRADPRCGWVVFGLLTLTLGNAPCQADDDYLTASQIREMREQRLEAVLAEQINVNVSGVPLRTFVTDLVKRDGIEVRFDDKEIAAQAIPLDRPVSVRQKATTLELVLARALCKYGLEARRDDGFLVIGLARRPPAAAKVAREIPAGQFIRHSDGRPRIRVYSLPDELAFDVNSGYLEIDPRLTDDELKRPGTLQRMLFSWLIEGGSSAGLTEMLQTQLRHQLDADHLIAGLTEIQREKLRLAGQREIQHHVTQANQLCGKFAEAYDPDDASIGVPRAYFEDVRKLAILRQEGLFGADSMFGRMRSRTLTSSQLRRMEAMASLRDAGAAVRGRPREAGIREIHISARPITDALLPHLAEFPELEALSLDSTKVTDEGLRHVESLQKLTWLDLSRTKIGNDGLKHVARLSRLERLELTGTLVTDEGIELLASLENLKSIDVSQTAVTDVGISRLRSEFSGLKVIR